MIPKTPHIRESSLWVIDLYLILFSTSWEIYSIPNELNILLSTNNETQCVHLLYLPQRFITYVPSSFVGKFCLEKILVNLFS